MLKDKHESTTVIGGKPVGYLGADGTWYCCRYCKQMLRLSALGEKCLARTERARHESEPGAPGVHVRGVE